MANRAYFKPAFDELAVDGVIGTPTGRPAYAYLRVSSDEQAEDGSSGLPRQIAHIHEAAQREGYAISWDRVYADDYTGFEFESRPALSRLRKEYASIARQADAVVIEHLDRLSRNADWHQGFLLDEMAKHGMVVVFWKSFASRIERSVLGAVSQESMEQAKRRMREGVLHKARSGRVTSSFPAFGYKFVDSNGEEGPAARKDTHYAIHEEQAAIIRQIFQYIAEGRGSARALSTWLTDQGIPSPRNSRHWEPRQISLFIRQEVYKGDFYANRVTNITVEKPTNNGLGLRKVKKKVERPREEWIHVPVPAIVTPELWEQANRMLVQNKTMASRNANQPFLLTGILKCAICGYSYIGRTYHRSKRKELETPYRGYACHRYLSRPAHAFRANPCDNKYVTVKKLEPAVWRVVSDVLLQPDQLIAALEHDATSERNQELGHQIHYLQEQMSDKAREDDKLMRAYLADVFDEQEYKAHRDRIKKEVATLHEELTRLEAQIITPELLEARKQEVLALSEHAHNMDLPIDPPFELKQQIIKLLIDKIDLNVKEGWFELHGAIPGKFPIVSIPAYQYGQ